MESEGLTACLLHNEPASYLCVAKLRGMSLGAVAKASPNRAGTTDVMDEALEPIDETPIAPIFSA